MESQLLLSAPAAAYRPELWHTFFATTATAAATLTGLFFIAFSLRVRDLQHSVLVRTRARYLLLCLIGCFALPIAALVPQQPLTALAVETLVVVTALWGYTLVTLVRAARLEPGGITRGVIARNVVGGVGTALAYAGSISCILRAGGGLYLNAAGLVLLLAVMVLSAWSLIVGIGRDSPVVLEHADVVAGLR